MRRRRLDAETAARLLRGVVPPGDAPPGYADAAALLQAASGATAEIDDAHASATVAAMAAAVTAPTTRRSTMPSNVSRRFTPKLAAAAAAGALSVAGVAAAVGGPLSAPIHGLAAAFHGDGRADESHPTTSTTADRNHGACVSRAAHDFDDHFATSSGDFASSTQHPDNHGARVSEVAHSDCGKKPEGDRG